jgi:hypothetical protein
MLVCNDVGPPSDAPDVADLLDALDAAEESVVDVMVEWFFSNFVDPVHNTPWDEGEYIYIWGGPYYAREELEDAFPNIPERLIGIAVGRVENEGGPEWSPSDSRKILEDDGSEDEPEDEPAVEGATP